MKLVLGATASLLAFAGASAAETVQISLTTDVMQEIVTLNSDPSFCFTDGPDAGFCPFFQPYVDYVSPNGTDPSLIWDVSQIPGSPAEGSTNVISHGVLDAVVTFDASVLMQDLTGFTNPDGTELGQSNNVSTFHIVSMGNVVADAAIGVSRVLVANDVVVGVGGEMLDLVGIQAVPADNPEFPVTLVLGGDDQWFEDAAGAIPDWTRVVAGAVEYEEIYEFGFQPYDNAPYRIEEIIEGSLDGGSFTVRSFGAADGSSESAPLLPDSVASSEPGQGPSFGFDLAEATVDVEGAGFVFIDPEIAIGYTYEMNGSGEIVALKAPSLDAVNDPDGYLITLETGESFTLLPGEEIALTDPVRSLRLDGIDQALMLDPASTTTFVMGFQFAGLDQTSSIIQTALTVNTDDLGKPYDQLSAVPLPAGIWLGLSGFAALGVMRGAQGRRRAL